MPDTLVGLLQRRANEQPDKLAYRFLPDGESEIPTLTYAELDRLTPRQVEVQSYRPEHDLFHWPLGFAIVLSVLYFGLVEFASMLRLRLRPARQTGESA